MNEAFWTRLANLLSGRPLSPVNRNLARQSPIPKGPGDEDRSGRRRRRDFAFGFRRPGAIPGIRQPPAPRSGRPLEFAPATSLGAALVLSGLLLAGGVALAEINLDEGPPPRPPVVTKQHPLVHVQCWREGVKIIDEAGLSKITLNRFLSQVTAPNVVDGRAVGLKGRDEKGGQVLIVPVRNATCLLRDAS